MPRKWQNLYLLSCLHFYWAQLHRSAVWCPECQEMKSVIYVMDMRR